ncbi:hypothetical protein T484DRAFT_1813161 [Baffinella frigidus]|nr:hypothetical protein T484DRAFT_1813161 [Cryptophyta sp. CCMP2293]
MAVPANGPSLKHLEEAEDRRVHLEEKLEESRVLERLREMRASLAQERRHSVDTLESCSTAILDYYQSIDAQDLSKHIKTRFVAWDLDHSQTLDKHELTEAMAAMGHRPSPEEVDKLMTKVDKDGSGTVELDEFEHMTSRPLL